MCVILGFSITLREAVLSIGENLTILDSVISDSMSGFLKDPPQDGCGGNVALYSNSIGKTLRIVNSLLTGGSTVGLGGFPPGGNLCVLKGKLILERSTPALRADGRRAGVRGRLERAARGTTG